MYNNEFVSIRLCFLKKKYCLKKKTLEQKKNLQCKIKKYKMVKKTVTQYM